MRGLIRILQWTIRMLGAADGHPPIYSSRCVACSEEPETGFDNPDEAQKWALAHSGRADREGQHHTVYQMITINFAITRPDPSVASLLVQDGH